MSALVWAGQSRWCCKYWGERSLLQGLSHTAGAGMLCAMAQMCSSQVLSLQVVHGMLSPTRCSYGLDHTCSPQMGPIKGTGTPPSKGKWRLGPGGCTSWSPDSTLGHNTSTPPAPQPKIRGKPGPKSGLMAAAHLPVLIPKPEGCHQCTQLWAVLVPQRQCQPHRAPHAPSPLHPLDGR